MEQTRGGGQEEVRERGKDEEGVTERRRQAGRQAGRQTDREKGLCERRGKEIVRENDREESEGDKGRRRKRERGKGVEEKD